MSREQRVRRCDSLLKVSTQQTLTRLLSQVSFALAQVEQRYSNAINQNPYDAAMKTLLTLIVLLTATAFAQVEPRGELQGMFRVARVVDGDTIRVAINGHEEPIRLIGIDTPETVHPTRGEEPYGRAASDFTKGLLEGRSVYLEFDVEERDRFGRLLAYVYIDDTFGEWQYDRAALTQVNYTLAEQG